MECKVCFEKYDKLTHKPIILIPCGHSFCLSCLYELKNKAFICPTCRIDITSEKPNYDLIELLDQNLVIDKHSNVKKEINETMKHVEEMKLKLECGCNLKLKESSEQLNCIKIKINATADEMVNNLRENQKKLLNRADEIQRNVNQKLNSYLNEFKTETKPISIEQLEKYELDKMKNDLHKMKTWLEIRLNETNDSCKFQFKVHSENLSLGEIIIFNSNDINERIEQSKNNENNYILDHIASPMPRYPLRPKFFGQDLCLNGMNFENQTKKIDATTSRTLSNDIIISGSNDKTIKIWSLNKVAKCILTLDGHDWAVFCLRLASKNILISASYDNRIKLWNLTSGRCINILNSHTSSILCIDATDEIVISGSLDKTIKIWLIKTGKCLLTLSGHSSYVKCLLILSNELIASGSGDKTIKIWNINTKLCIMTLNGHTSYPWILKSLSNNTLLSASYDKTVKIWKMETGEIKADHKEFLNPLNNFTNLQGECIHTLKGHTSFLSCLQIVNNWLITGSSDKTIKTWELNTGKCIGTLAHESSVSCMVILGEFLISGSTDGVMKIWRYENGELVYKIEGHSVGICCLSVVAEIFLVTGHEDGTIRIWNALNIPPVCVSILNDHTASVKCLEIAKK